MGHKRGRKPSGRVRDWWTPIKLDPGKSLLGWVAGAAVGVDTHFRDGASRVCEAVYTDGAVVCPYCAVLPIRFKSYVPVWGEAGERWLAIIPERFFDVADQLKHLDPVKVTMTRARGNPYFVGRSGWTSDKPRLSGVSSKSQDVWPHLLTMWGVSAEFRAWVAAHPVAGDTPVSPATVTPVPHSTGMVPPVELVEEAHRRRKAAGLVVPAGPPLADFPALAARLAEGQSVPSPNGKHKPPKKG